MEVLEQNLRSLEQEYDEAVKGLAAKNGELRHGLDHERRERIEADTATAARLEALGVGA